MSKDDTDIAMKIIQENFGYGMPGTHTKQCEICGGVFEEPNDLNILLPNGPYQCPNCKVIFELEKVLIDHWNRFLASRNKNLIAVVDATGTRYTANDYELSYEIQGRSKFVTQLITKIDEARRQLYLPLDAQLKILESIYEKRDRFWYDGGNLAGYVRNASFQMLVVKLREFLGGKAKYSYEPISNELRNRSNDLYKKHHIIEVRHFKRIGKTIKTLYPRFPIEEYLEKLDNVISTYKKEIDTIILYRDKVFAHTDTLKQDELEQRITFRIVKRILNAFKIIYDGFLYSLAPDKFTQLNVEHNMWFEHMNEISQFWADHKK